ncbi:MAG TPA: LuxR C-terminal-related transcriptional regulator [Brevundimonas sp.]|nr:LuxR C-terminal-related transcriptional regulator [Brevundimonas sp.]
MAHDLDEDGAALLASIARSPIASVISNPRVADNPIIAVNEAFCTLTGYAEGEILGRNCRFLAGPATEPWLTERIRKGTRERKPTLVEILNYKRDGQPFRNAVLVAPVFLPNGELEYFLGSQVELPDDEIGLSSSRHQRAVEIVRTLSPRQREVLQQIAAGYRSKQISYNLSLSEKTVKMHRALLLEKIGTHNIADAIRLAVEAGLQRPPMLRLRPKGRMAPLGANP